MPGVNATRKIILCLFTLGVILVLTGHRYQSAQQASQITWHDVNLEMQQVEASRLALFESLDQKAAERH